jgi:hypothetical protein
MSTRKIDVIRVKVTYEVGLRDVDVPVEVGRQLIKMFIKGRPIGSEMAKYPEASNWLTRNINEGLCTSCEYQIDTLE